MDRYLVQCMGPERDRWTGPLAARTPDAAARRGVREIRSEMEIQEVRAFAVADAGDWFDAEALFDDPPEDPEAAFRERRKKRREKKHRSDKHAEERRLGYRND